LHFAPADPENLAAKVEGAWIQLREMWETGRAAWAEYEAGYTAKRDCEMLTGIYRRAIGAGWKVSSVSPTARR